MNIIKRLALCGLAVCAISAYVIGQDSKTGLKDYSATSEAKLLRNYIQLLEAPADKRTELFSQLEGDDAVNVNKLQISLRLANSPNLSEDKKSSLLQMLLDLSSGSRKAAFSKVTKADSGYLTAIQNYVRIAGMATEAVRKQTFLGSTAEDKRSIWKTRLAVHLASEPLDASKQLLVMEIVTILNTEPVYARTETAETRAKYDDFEKRARKEFGKSDTFRLFMSLGNETGCPRSSKGTNEPDNLGYCNCYYDTYCNLQNEWWLCQGGCTHTSGCGIIFETECVGKCRA